MALTTTAVPWGSSWCLDVYLIGLVGWRIAWVVLVF